MRISSRPRLTATVLAWAVVAPTVLGAQARMPGEFLNQVPVPVAELRDGVMTRGWGLDRLLEHECAVNSVSFLGDIDEDQLYHASYCRRVPSADAGK